MRRKPISAQSSSPWNSLAIDHLSIQLGRETFKRSHNVRYRRKEARWAAVKAEYVIETRTRIFLIERTVVRVDDVSTRSSRIDQMQDVSELKRHRDRSVFLLLFNLGKQSARFAKYLREARHVLPLSLDSFALPCFVNTDCGQRDLKP
ncbi:hypothetical protein WL49_29910 [Burkholderia ubonensis]|nr:hypothetical protein WL49_29910 [Burkholderia ubonensis]